MDDDDRKLERQQWIFRVGTATITALGAANILLNGDKSDWWVVILAVLIYGFVEYLHQLGRGRRKPPKR